MITREEMLSYIEKEFTLKQVLQDSNYTASQVIYACKKYNLKLLTRKKKFNVDKNKVKALLDSNFKISEIADILKVNKRCVYNVLYRNGWSSKKDYPSNRKKRIGYSNYGLKVSPSSTLEFYTSEGTSLKVSLKFIIKELFPQADCSKHFNIIEK